MPKFAPIGFLCSVGEIATRAVDWRLWIESKVPPPRRRAEM